MRRLFNGVTLLLCLATSSALASPPDWRTKIAGVKMGQSRKEVQKAMGEFKVEDWNAFVELYADRLGFLGGVPTDIWLVDATTLNTVGGKTYVIAIYSKDNGLRDLLTFRPQMYLHPILEGEYARRLESIKMGMNIDDIYRLLGKDTPYRYFRDDKTRKWKVEFHYEGVHEFAWLFTADAATGDILKIQVLGPI